MPYDSFGNFVYNIPGTFETAQAQQTLSGHVVILSGPHAGEEYDAFGGRVR